ncbi:hypothetical protein KLMA_30621 [Kluyveromyces marxianus]|uniref:Uncharacterized protein n=2 Tax=Kluyveromyces marxianus TaxID=4911 RepID=W0TAU6_KLUMD|nr:hypothetical protein KLMA_30621 [Kluyveromyces marxianus DMKU3-1042]QGN15629.1 protein MEH1 [Kluyveromyces marxianus]BAO39916.1 hypothetical protein KLMA_30621 [Kluyveromyces marxianus DMKU3-1042]BAP71397.1 hypothetical protein KLMA_30621 [Kluyveromyces marxianus]
MGNVLSCCFGHDEESDPLLQEQSGYGSQAQLDFNEMEQRQKESIRQRERELTEIVNSTNDKLIDIGMISNSGIVASSHDLDSGSINGPISQSQSRNNNISSANPPLTPASTSKITNEVKCSLKQFHEKYFETLKKNFTITYNKPLVTDIQT